MVDPTIKVTLEGTPEAVERLSARVKELFTVTYESKDRAKPHSPDNVIRYLRLKPPSEDAFGAQNPKPVKPNKKSRPHVP